MTDDSAPRRRAGSAYVVAPDAGTGPGVLVLHSWWGLTTFVRQWCDRLADEGFVALAPDLYAGESADRPDEAEQLLAQMDVDRAADLVLSSAGALRDLPITDDGPIGVVGFSMGASWGLWLAARAPEHVGASVAYYGTQGIPLDDATSAFLGHFAERDELVSDDEVVELEAHLHLVGKAVEFHRYAGTGHWFAEEDRPAAYDPGAAALAWERTVRFLRHHLDR
ncbi:dienelactone hydrolase family protein [Actinomarinicola tropica]|nr:dienelactone hydrolase family protein [Actinomarinicola tropica]